MVKQTIQMKMY